MARFSTFLFVLAVGTIVAYFLSHDSSPVLRQLTMPITKIESLVGDPTKYEGMTVKVAGTVVGSLGVMGVGGFRLLEPQSGNEILVMSSGGIPPNGTSLTVIGKFRQAAAVGAYQYGVIFKQD